MSKVFTLSIKPAGDEPSFIHGFHLGTDLDQARLLAETFYHGRNSRRDIERDHNNRKMATESVAIKRGEDIVDIYDGRWMSEPLNEEE